MTPEPPDRPIRQLSRAVEAIHTLSYYSPEISRFTDAGFRGWWHAYFAYRAAPMGAVDAATVEATFYNFAPRMVARAVDQIPRPPRPGSLEHYRQKAEKLLIAARYGFG